MKKSGGETLESMSQAIWYNQWTLEKFKSYLNGNILEVGCGVGNFTKTLTKFGQVWAMDIQKDYVSKTMRMTRGKAKVGIGDIEKGKYFFKNLEFDSEVCINVLEHIKDDQKALKNLHHLLDNRGYLILIVPSHRFLYGEIDRAIGHFRRYTKEEVEEKLKNAGFKIVKIRRINFLGAIGWFFASRILFDKVVSRGKIKIFNLFAPTILRLESLIEPPIGTSILAIAKKEKKERPQKT